MFFPVWLNNVIKQTASQIHRVSFGLYQMQLLDMHCLSTQCLKVSLITTWASLEESEISLSDETV